VRVDVCAKSEAVTTPSKFTTESRNPYAARLQRLVTLRNPGRPLLI
jgi:hypothetical protein